MPDFDTGSKALESDLRQHVGGHSLYPNDDEGRGAIVAFDRPNGPAFFEYDVYLPRWLEEVGRRRGFSVDCATDFDVHRDPTSERDFGFTDQYRLMISGAHEKYWSKEEFDGFERRIHRLGRNTIVFGANTAKIGFVVSSIA